METDKYVRSNMLERLADIVISVDMDIFPIIYHTQSEKWLIRHDQRTWFLCDMGEPRGIGILYWSK
ncbi:MAG: hypothetical protein K2O91_00985 [Lachnospiraceae bacterium]|nr:hypothetical protein [Lachnospiraceae bacterium]